MARNFNQSLHELFNDFNNQARVITIANFKGGVGKSTLNSILAYIATEKYGLKVLQIDSDPQCNLTQKMYRTFKKPIRKAEKSFLDGIKAEDLSKSITTVTDKLDLIEGAWEMALLMDHLSKYPKDANADYDLYDYLIRPLRTEYDLIMFDVIPTTTAYTNNCICASDYVLMPTQTEEDAYNNTKTFIDYLITMKQQRNNRLELIGIVPYLVERDMVDRKILERYQTEYPEITFNNLIKSSARVKTWGLDGITENKNHDKKTLKMYDLVFQEMIKRMAGIETITI